MKCGDTCRHNISKLNSGLSVKLLQLPLQRSGKAFEGNLPYFCKKVSFWYATFIGFSGCCEWLARLYACFRKVAPFALTVEVFALVHCHHTPTLPLQPPPPPRARARSPRLVKPRHGWLGLAWYGMAWCESQVLS